MQPAGMAPSRPNDPLQYTLALPFEAEYYPMGFPLRIATNHRPALAAAESMWSRFPRRFVRAPMRVHLTVDLAPQRRPPGEPVLRGQGHLFSIVAGRANFVTADLRSGFGHISVSAEVAADIAYFRYHFLEPLAYVLIASRHVAFVHASSVALDNRALILSGPSGAGKTCLAYACARRGWSFLSGDAVAILNCRADQRAYRIAGRPFEIRFRHTASHLFPELSEFPRVLRPSGKTDLEIDPASLGLSTSVDGAAAGLVFLDRVIEPRPASMARISAQEARGRLEESICFGDESIRNRHGRTLDRLSRLPAAILRYSDFDAAEAALRAFLGQRG